MTAMSVSAVPPASSQSEASPFGSRPGRWTMRTTLAMPSRDCATCAACRPPGRSLSGRMATRRPRKCVAYSSRHLSAPPAFVVATNPTFGQPVGILFAFNDQDPIAGSAASSSGRRYGTRRTSPRVHIQPPCRPAGAAESPSVRAHDLIEQGRRLRRGSRIRRRCACRDRRPGRLRPRRKKIRHGDGVLAGPSQLQTRSLFRTSRSVPCALVMGPRPFAQAPRRIQITSLGSGNE